MPNETGSGPEPTTPIVDVAVVGAGPTGAVAAHVAAGRGLRVALVDQATFPRDKTCGDGVGPGVTPLLRRLGLAHLLDGHQPIEHITIYSPDGRAVDTPVPVLDGEPLTGVVVPREEFDAALRDAALAAGAIDMAGHKLVGLDDVADGHRTLTLRSGTGTRRVRARLVVGADGAYSAVRRMLGIARNPDDHMVLAMRAYAETSSFDPGTPLGPRLIFEFSDALTPGYGWIFPTGDGLANVGVGLPLDVMRARKLDLRTMLEQFAEASRARGVDLGPLRDVKAHHLPTSAAVPPLAHPRLALVGDAASMINPLSGEGIVYGMTVAEELVRRLPTDLADDGALAAALAGFEAWHTAKYRRNAVACQRAQRLMRRSWTANLMFGAARRSPSMLDGAVRLLFGLGELRLRRLWRLALPGRRSAH